jgi:hypothetical protein
MDDELNVILEDFVFFHEIPKGRLFLPELSWERFWHPYTMSDLRYTQNAPLGYFQLDGNIIYRDNLGAIWTSDGYNNHEISLKAVHDYAVRYFKIPKGSGPPTDDCGQYGFWHLHSARTFIAEFVSKPDFVSSEEFTNKVFHRVEEPEPEEQETREERDDRVNDLIFLFVLVFFLVTVFQTLFV